MRDTYGFKTPGELLAWLLTKSAAKRKTTLAQAADEFARRPLDYGKKGELGAAVVHENRRKHFVVWMPPQGPGPFTARNRLTVELLLDALVGNASGQAIPNWLLAPFRPDVVDSRPGWGAVRLLTGQG
jgi:hypothetical protein